MKKILVFIMGLSTGILSAGWFLEGQKFSPADNLRPGKAISKMFMSRSLRPNQNADLDPPLPFNIPGITQGLSEIEMLFFNPPARLSASSNIGAVNNLSLVWQPPQAWPAGGAPGRGRAQSPDLLSDQQQTESILPREWLGRAYAFSDNENQSDDQNLPGKIVYWRYQKDFTGCNWERLGIGILGLILAGAIIYWLGKHPKTKLTGPFTDSAPLQILKNRYAWGAITRSEYEEIKSVLEK